MHCETIFIDYANRLSVGGMATFAYLITIIILLKASGQFVDIVLPFAIQSSRCAPDLLQIHHHRDSSGQMDCFANQTSWKFVLTFPYRSNDYPGGEIERTRRRRGKEKENEF